MEVATIWYLLIGAILVLIGITSSYFAKLPVTTSILYFLIGVGLGNHGVQFIHYDLVKDAHFFERLTEIVVLISLFSAGLKLRLPFRDDHWGACWRLATFSMIITIGLVTLFAIYVLKMPTGLAILLGAILAPTDPVLASDVQVAHEEDRDRLRFSLTGEAGLNDGTAFPFVMLGLGLLGFYEIGSDGFHWVLKDLLWASAGGLFIGWTLGSIVSRVVLKLRTLNEETLILDDFLALGLIALSYGIAIACHTYGFLAVFAAGLAMRKIEKNPTTGKTVQSSTETKTTIAKAVLSFTEQMERIGVVFVVLLLGAAFNIGTFVGWDLLVIPVLFMIIRPIAVYVGLGTVPLGHYRRPLISWFGIRGIGTIYYLTYALGKGLPAEQGGRLLSIAYATVVISIFVHGVSGFPFMKFYHERRSRAKSGV